MNDIFIFFITFCRLILNFSVTSIDFNQVIEKKFEINIEKGTPLREEHEWYEQANTYIHQ